MFVTWAHGAGAGLGVSVFIFLFCEICGSSGTFSGDYDPAIKQKIFSDFVVKHVLNPDTVETGLSILVFPIGIQYS